jgi:glycosyltransferase involved in cell wall biosynthesis
MLLSLYSPCHNGAYLPDLWCSIQRQHSIDFEWVIVPNKNAQVPEYIRRDPRVKVVSGGNDLQNIGALKRLGCDHCTGDVLIEMDSDDLLMPGTAFKAVADAYLAGGEYIYSDAAIFTYPGYRTHTYSPDYGWKSYPIRLYGRELKACHTHEISPITLSSIHYAPDHIRCQTRKAYLDVGGYNASLPICEDHELMCRFYAKGKRFVHAGGCQYIYRMHVMNSCRLSTSQVPQLTAEVGRNYFKTMVYEWLNRHNHPYLNLTQEWKKGWTFQRLRAKPAALGEDKYGVIEANDILQYCPPELMASFMNACWDAIIPGGYLLLRVPNDQSLAGNYDPRTKLRFNLASFLWYTRREYAARMPEVRCRFQEVCLYNEPQNPVEKKYHLRNLCVQLMALKGQPHPGFEYI